MPHLGCGVFVFVFVLVSVCDSAGSIAVGAVLLVNLVLFWRSVYV